VQVEFATCCCAHSAVIQTCLLVKLLISVYVLLLLVQQTIRYSVQRLHQLELSCDTNMHADIQMGYTMKGRMMGAVAQLNMQRPTGNSARQ